MPTADIIKLYDKAANLGYVLMPSDYTVLGYIAADVEDERRTRYCCGELNNMVAFVANHPRGNAFQRYFDIREGDLTYEE